MYTSDALSMIVWQQCEKHMLMIHTVTEGTAITT